MNAAANLKSNVTKFVTNPKPILNNVGTIFPEFNGMQIKGYEPGHKFQHYVPKEEEGYVFRRDFLREYISWHNSHADDMGFMIVGPAGSGKTSAVKAINHHFNIPTIHIGFHRDTSLLELKGGMQFATDPNTKQTVTRYVYGPLTMAFKYGFTLILGENNTADPAVNNGLNDIVRGNVLTIEATGETIKRHPDFRAIADGNGWGRGDDELRYAGTVQQNSAYLDRWWKHTMSYPEPEVEREIIKSQCPALNDILLEGIVRVTERIRPLIRGVSKDPKASLDIEFSTRMLVFWARIMQDFPTAPYPMKYALEIVLLRALNDTERQVIVKACADTLNSLADGRVLFPLDEDE
jgi:cobaltochelatase CobS